MPQKSKPSNYHQIRKHASKKTNRGATKKSLKTPRPSIVPSTCRVSQPYSFLFTRAPTTTTTTAALPPATNSEEIQKKLSSDFSLDPSFDRQQEIAAPRPRAGSVISYLYDDILNEDDYHHGGGDYYVPSSAPLPISSSSPAAPCAPPCSSSSNTSPNAPQPSTVASSLGWLLSSPAKSAFSPIVQLISSATKTICSHFGGGSPAAIIGSPAAIIGSPPAAITSRLSRGIYAKLRTFTGGSYGSGKPGYSEGK